eukprot:gene1443-1464_t
MEIKRSGSQASTKGPDEYFTGTVRIDPLNSPPDPARVAMALVTFEPGARTAWHTHPFGQTLIVTAGFGWAQHDSGPVEEIRQGDVVWFPAGEKPWHGASPTTAMSHIAIQEKLDGSPVTWMEKVIANGSIPWTCTTVSPLVQAKWFMFAGSDAKPPGLKFVAHACVELTGDHRHVFDRWVAMGRDDVAGGHFQPQHVFARAERVAGQYRDLGAGREGGRHRAVFHFGWAGEQVWMRHRLGVGRRGGSGNMPDLSLVFPVSKWVSAISQASVELRGVRGGSIICRPLDSTIDRDTDCGCGVGVSFGQIGKLLDQRLFGYRRPDNVSLGCRLRAPIKLVAPSLQFSADFLVRDQLHIGIVSFEKSLFDLSPEPRIMLSLGLLPGDVVAHEVAHHLRGWTMQGLCRGHELLAQFGF